MISNFINIRMCAEKWRAAVLSLLCIFFTFPHAYSESKYDLNVDSLKHEISLKSGHEKLLTSLSLAENLRGDNLAEAIELVESVAQEAQQTHDKLIEMQANYFLGKTYSVMNKYEKSDFYLNSALEISKELKDKWYEGEILYRKGVNNHNIGEDILALELFNEALPVCRLSNNYKTLGSIYSMMGTGFRINGLYDRAIEYIIKSKLNYEKANFIEGNAWTAYLLGRIYFDLQVYPTSLEYFMESLEIYERLAAEDGNQNGVAICSEQIGLVHMELSNLAEARKNIEHVLAIHLSNDSQYGISTAYKHLGMIDYSNKNYEQAEDYLNRSLDMKVAINDQLSQSGLYLYLGLSKIALNKTQDGFQNILKGLDLALENNQRKIQLDIYSKLSQAYLNLNNLKQANFYLRKQVETQKIMLFGVASVKMEQLQAIYEIDEKNIQIAELEAQNEIATLRIRQQKINQTIMIFGIALVLIIAIIIYVFYSQIRKKNNLLNEANATKDRLFSIIAHDLRGPVGSMLGLSEIFVDEINQRDISLLEKHASMMNKSLNQTFELLNNLLDWSRSQMHGVDFNPSKLMLYKTIGEVGELLMFQMEEKHLNFEVSVDKSYTVYADERMLKAIFRNLISNAIKFSNSGGHINVSAFLKRNVMEICVQDNGVGIEPEICEGLFNLETNTSTVGTSGEKGTGLGLILAQEFVAKHKGKIWVNTKVGQGSTFCFNLPLV